MGYEYPFRGDDVPKKITAGYGYYPDGITEHYGLDFSAASETSLFCPGSATVIKSFEDKKYGAGYTISFKMDETTPTDTTVITYMHMFTNPGDIILEGQHIGVNTYVGQVGSTGNSTGPHLHISVMNDGTWIAGDLIRTNNPLRYYTQYKFTGPEDRTEYDFTTKGYNESDNYIEGLDKRIRAIWDAREYDHYMYCIPGVLIKHIGEKYLEWSNRPYENANEMSLFSCLNYFNISNEEFIEILESNPYEREDFTDKMLQEIFDARVKK